MITLICYCLNRYFWAMIVCTRTSNTTITFRFYNYLILIYRKFGSKSNIFCNNNSTWIFGVSVWPFHKVVTLIYYCLNDCLFAIIVCTTTCYCTIFICLNIHLILIYRKFSSKSQIFSNYNSTWIFGVSVWPFHEVVMLIRCSSQCYCITMIIHAINIIHQTISTWSYLHIILINCKFSSQLYIFCNHNNTWIFSITIRPLHEVITFCCFSR